MRYQVTIRADGAAFYDDDIRVWFECDYSSLDARGWYAQSDDTTEDDRMVGPFSTQGEAEAAAVVELGNRSSRSTGHELARILRELAEKCETHAQGVECPLRDVNGNTVGQAGWVR